MSDDDWKTSSDWSGDPDNLEIIFDPEIEKECYVESAAKHTVWDQAYLRMAIFASDALSLIAPAGVATIRTRTGAGCVCLLIHARKHVFNIYLDSSSRHGQRIRSDCETLADNLRALIPVYEGLEGPRGWSKVLRQIAKFEGIDYIDSFMLEEQEWEAERQEREEEERERRRREQQDEDKDEGGDEAS